MDTHEIIPGNYPTIGDVRVKFKKTIEVEEQPYSENEVLATIANLEQRKLETIAGIDDEIKLNNEMLLKIRAVDRAINTIE